AAGVLFREGQLYLTCIPHLWLLKDADGDGRAETRNSLSEGYGVRFAFRGHDMHGLIVGPDGRLYFSIGDRGLNVKQGDRQLVNSESGAVLRCEPDGSNLELFATGLRNPQELAFDDFGNLFTGDNNSDSGDRARWVHVVQGGDSGWRMAYQYLSDRGPFNREKIWQPYDPVGNALRGVPEQPAYIVPPVANFASGPSGLAYYPGTGLPEHFKNRFLLVDFRGGPANSGVRSLRVKPKGATFELVDSEATIWRVLATDVDFGPDGAIYLSDWVNGWDGEGKGRIYRFAPTDAAIRDAARETQQLLTEDFSKRSADELIRLLAHSDRRVRQESQFALVGKREAAALTMAAKTNDNQLARLHALWGLSQLQRQGGLPAQLIAHVLPLLDDPDAEIRAQSAKMLGEASDIAAADMLIAHLKDDSPRVRSFAAQSIANLGQPRAIEPLLKLLEDNADKDPVLRHAAVMGLVGSAGRSSEALVAQAKHPSPSARLGVLLALRRLGAAEVSQFLNDADPWIVVEAARAIHDVPIPAAMPKLAAFLSRGSRDEAVMHRVLNANYRAGTPEAAQAIAAYAARGDVPTNLRVEALEMLGRWEKPSGRDRVLGMWRPLPDRPAADAAAALRANLAGIFKGSDRVRERAGQSAATLGIKEVIPELRTLLADTSQPAAARAGVLSALVTLNDEGVEAAARGVLSDKEPAVRAAARTTLAQGGAEDAVALLTAAAEQGERVERQAALAALGSLKAEAAGAALARGLDQLLAGSYPADSRLDLLTAAAKFGGDSLQQKLAEFEGRRAKDDPLSPFAECADGGDATRGRQLFFERSQLSCVRCHKIGETGGDVGPELTRIAADKKRDYLLESLVAPSKTIAKNFESVVVLDIDGVQHTGIVKQEDGQKLTLMTPEGRLVTIAQDRIDGRKPGQSSMPEDLLKYVTKAELRDLVEFLATLK
ncbi:MAG TPA: HEAT repeat domain-containing protein, partial [Pirellulaceae bacterium]|nr:HEAT repeat domain-containing protein [Pirellulaceae bacterium]